MNSFRPLFVIGIGLFVSIMGFFSWGFVFDHSGRHGLRHVVQDFCVPIHKSLGMPFPCLVVDEENDMAILHAPFDHHEILITPISSISGLEYELRSNDIRSFSWSSAWEQRHVLDHQIDCLSSGRQIALAVNSAVARSQDHLHIHVDCLRKSVHSYFMSKDDLEKDPRTSKWVWMKLPPHGHMYRVKVISSDMFHSRNMSFLIHDAFPSDIDISRIASISVTSIDDAFPEKGFVLAVTTDGGFAPGGYAEELLDH